MTTDFDRCYRAILGRDDRFDGQFWTAVTSTGIYCRPSCPARTPKREHVRFYRSAGAAQAAGFRACKRCRPDAAPGSPEWNARADVAARAVRLIGDGVVDRDGVAGLAHRLGCGERHLHRQLVAELGAGPLALARAQRANTARMLLQTTDLPVTAVAFAAGFASIRQFNDTIHAVYGGTPTELRRRRRVADAVSTGAIELRLACREPFAGGALLRFFARRAVPGVEEVVGGVYRRTLRLPHGAGIAELTLDPGAIEKAGPGVRCVLELDDLRDLAAAVARCRRLLDLDADPAAVALHFAADPVLGPLAARYPGVRIPRTVDGAELAVRVIVGQHGSVAAARSLAARLVVRHGEPLPAPSGGLTHLFPEAAALGAADPAGFGLPQAQADTLRALSASIVDGRIRLDASADREATVAALLTLPGIGPPAASCVAMRAMGDPDVFLPTEPGMRQVVATLDLAAHPDAAAPAESWRPWRSYATCLVWQALDERTRCVDAPRGAPPNGAEPDEEEAA